MSDIEQKLIEYMDKTAGAIEKVTELSIEQAPLIVREYVSWGIVDGLITGISFSLLLILTLFFAVKIWKYNENLDARMSVIMTASFLALSFMFCGFTAYSHAAKAYFAPRVYVIEKLRGAK